MLGKKKQKPRRATGNFDTLISSRTTIEGDVRFSGGLHVDGKIKGRVMAEEGSDAVVRLSEVGEVTGDITAPHVIINGRVNGDVRASSHLELAEKASINGSVYYRLIEMAMGASVNGNLVRQDETSGLLTHDNATGGAGAAASEDEDKSE
ncbi:MAG: Integral membrane protein CcmA involved in cell shape determination [Marinobacter excellens HL-55]|uniref:Integral membrane protein CcmA involved in cell shape determination n=1 Tax=Marinobacter excellens HL-55 TaxID=1305731 RepID=A0A0P7YB82_9GAMM|nr:MAG: Integral membrane protein CcmA involved in cell shape determination [Marinobacter excellens HL-55]